MNETLRILAEDALKHVYRCEQQRQPATIESLAGALAERGAHAADVLAQLQAAGLITLQDAQFSLTDAGRTYALQVIRAHRLYETYLALETGHQEDAWHREADVQEHKLSEAEVTQLARQLGHPRFDPHGDPIPTADGRVVVTEGRSLTDWPVGVPARIVHVEDEPESIYSKLVALGLCPGMELTVLSADAEQVVLTVNGRQRALSPVVAANLSVASPKRGAARVSPEMVEPLSALRLGERARVVNLSPRCRGAERRRLMDLGILPNTLIEAELKSPVGDPTGYRVRETVVALRREQADLINIVKAQA